MLILVCPISKTNDSCSEACSGCGNMGCPIAEDGCLGSCDRGWNGSNCEQGIYGPINI